MQFRKNVFLKNHTTFKIGGEARYFCVVKNKREIVEAVKKAKELNLPFFVLGGGSNILISDKGFNGLIIKNEARNVEVKKETIIAESGAFLSQVIIVSIRNGLSGLVGGAGIPGTIGGAVFGNAGWPKGKWSIGNVVKEVEILLPGGKTKRIEKSLLAFDYRSSRFKKIKGKKPIILEVVLQLKKGRKKELENKLRNIIKTRSGKIPTGFSVGCIFKNPKGFSAGELIDGCGLKGKRIDGAQISEKHANFIVNLGGAKAKDVVKLIKIMKQRVKDRFKIKLEEEIQYLGF